jgi:uncharacterized protein (TIGR00369 family)
MEQSEGPPDTITRRSDRTAITTDVMRTRYMAESVRADGDYVDVGPHHLLTSLLMRRVDDPVSGPSLEMDLRDDVVNPHGSLHGGLMGVLIECGAAGCAVRAAGSENIVASDMQIRFLTAVKVGPARVLSTVLRRGRGAVVVQSDVIDVGDDRKLVASATLSYAILDRAGGG